jgi:hypothetical protein
MDGSAASLIAIPIVVTLGLVTWLCLIAYAVRHPHWTHSASTAARGNHVPGDGQLASAEPRVADHVVIEMGQDAGTGEAAKLAA